ncbi:hypothetical protein EFN99_06840, partial [Lactococcus lactis]|nr:hypothetical protein [Lactococcus lactis]
MKNQLNFEVVSDEE